MRMTPRGCRRARAHAAGRLWRERKFIIPSKIQFNLLKTKTTIQYCATARVYSLAIFVPTSPLHFLHYLVISCCHLSLPATCHSVCSHCLVISRYLPLATCHLPLATCHLLLCLFPLFAANVEAPTTIHIISHHFISHRIASLSAYSSFASTPRVASAASIGAGPFSAMMVSRIIC
jgi:hypothetical protein